MFRSHQRSLASSKKKIFAQTQVVAFTLGMKW